MSSHPAAGRAASPHSAAPGPLPGAALSGPRAGTF
ncbi:hypothetical protein B7760_00639 [Burkholderia glumae]|nr:hypothetical protein KS03_2064 [Burkholderia glumae LMG 2196 = ATCC 33617]QKM46640.1 hypothetical protein B7760_00639 [Burkholderia glumae]QKM54048.1 hypothetical protein CG017_02075 [Burkholderia glumae]QTP32268.1 hypothetical protein B7759_00837 [Burkholderia glumae]